MREYGVQFAIAIRRRLSHIAGTDLRIAAGNVYTVYGAMFLGPRPDTGQFRMQRTGMVARGYAIFDTSAKVNTVRGRVATEAQGDRCDLLQIPQERVSAAILRESGVVSTGMPAIYQQL